MMRRARPRPTCSQRGGSRLRPDGERARRGRRLRLIGAGSAALLVVVVVAGVLGASGGRTAPGRPVGGAFAQHYDGLTARRDAAAVTTMMDTMDSKAHFHPELTIVADGEPIPVPSNVGIDPREDGMQMASLHTHDEGGAIHVEGQAGSTLGQFFAVWGVPLSAQRLGPFRRPVRMLVNGKRSTAYGKLRLADGQRILLTVGRGGPKR